MRSLLLDLKGGGLRPPALFITDESKGIIAVLKLGHPHTKRQLCAFYKVNNIQVHLIDISNRKDIMREAMDIYKLSDSRNEAVKRFKLFRRHWKDKKYEAVRLFSRNFEDTLTYFDFPKEDRISIYTTNPMEQFIAKKRDWTAKFNYFRGHGNLELAIYTYLCYKNEGLLSEEGNQSNLPKYTFYCCMITVPY